MKLVDQVKQIVDQAIQALAQKHAVDTQDVDWVIETPQDENHGDFSTNAAMKMVKKLKSNPRQVAQELVEELMQNVLFQRVEIAGPGFINFFLNPKVLFKEMEEILTKGAEYGRSSLGQNEKVRIEFVSANPTGPLHVGHGRGAVIGDVLASLYEFCGYQVTREYYLNDCGNQMVILGKTTRAWVEALAEQKEPAFLSGDPEDKSWYRGDYMRDVAQRFTQEELEHYNDAQLGRLAGQVILERIKLDLKEFGVKEFDIWFSEKSLHDSGKIKEALDILKTKNMVEEKDGAWWFLSSKLGDDKDRVVVKSDQSLTYLAADIAFHDLKFKEGYERVIDIWGADHHGYIARVKAAIASFGHNPEKFSVILCQLVRLLRNGEVVPMSTRSGEFVTLKEIVDEVGSDVVRFYFLMRKSDAHLDFDLEIAKQQSMDNPVYYIQYAHARIASIQRQFEDAGLVLSVASVNWACLVEKEELKLLKLLTHFKDSVECAVMNNDPHQVVSYLQELASAFHGFYRQCRIVGAEEAEQTLARMALANAAQQVIQNGMRLLGVSCPEKM